MLTRVYRYGLLPPEGEGRAIFEEIAAKQFRYRNAMIETRKVALGMGREPHTDG